MFNMEEKIGKNLQEQMKQREIDLNKTYTP